jgi:protein-S-isoprenylcysteine O-methyltransferase Ste14
VVLPGTVAVVVPSLLVDDVDLSAVRAVVGGALIACGLALFVWTVSLFARIGRGTLAPWDPTRRLVVAGPYRHVRNPMITAVVAVLMGEAVLFGSVAVAIWAAVFFVVNSLWFVLHEEPGLERRFGEEYREYRRAVPRWLPRLRRR